jgi:riboflavin transporter
MSEKTTTMGRPAGAGTVKSRNLSTLIKISVLSAMAFVLMLLDFPLPIFPSFLKIDLSDLPALLGAFALGPVAGVIIELVKNLLNMVLRGTITAGVGELANFIVGGSFVFAAGFIYKKQTNRKGAIIGLIVGTLAMSLIASIANYTFLIPLYAKAFKMPIDAYVAMGAEIFSGITSFETFILFSILPFNILKGIIVGFVTFLAYKKLSPILHK